MRYSLEALQTYMKRWGWNIAVVSGSDPHGSEYTPQRWRLREFITGFTGSAGTVVVTQNSSGLWTDSRYFLQAEQQLANSGSVLHKEKPGNQTWSEWIAEYCAAQGKEHVVIGIDGMCHSYSQIDELKRSCPNATIVSSPDYIDPIWTDRPALPKDKVWILGIEYAGTGAAEKLSALRKVMARNGCSAALISDLMQIAWLLNIRSNDVLHTPVVISYCLVEQDRVVLFADPDKFSTDILDYFGKTDNFELHSYYGISDYLKEYNVGDGIMLHSKTLNYHLYSILQSKCPDRIVDMEMPVNMAKAAKNPTEISGFRQAYLFDGIAQTRFFKWLEESVSNGKKVSEADAAAKMSSLRALNPQYIDDSFGTISAYGANGAYPHYDYSIAKKETYLEPHGLYLIDSGAHYRCGTTDITRTVPLGELTDQERFDYTIVLKSMIGLSMAVFPEHTAGARLDCLMREPMWRCRLNYGHGSGHGVGHLLSVHEGPQGIRQDSNPAEFVPGVVMSNEPGIYIEGKHGVRHENMLLCVEDCRNEYGTWFRFDTITRTYIDTTCLACGILSQEELAWIRDFNRICIEELSPYLEQSEIEWLLTKTK